MVAEMVRNAMFRAVHSRSLVYNTCWEDPRLDRYALNFHKRDRVLMITSAGCNALDYLLAGAGAVECVDVNPLQNALLQLKIAALQALSWDQFFELFGRGRLHGVKRTYRLKIRPLLEESARQVWDQRIHLFDPTFSDVSFYFRGTSGVFARALNAYIDHVAHLRGPLNRAFAAGSIEEQQEIYRREIKPRFWGRAIKFLVNRSVLLSLVGVPPAQRATIERGSVSTVAALVEQALDSVFGKLSLKDNYFWRVYINGEYTPDCCPEYLRRENFALLREMVAGRLAVYTLPIHERLETSEEWYSKFVLLDHMDWLVQRQPVTLAREWQALVDRAAPGARVLWRSAADNREDIDAVRVDVRRHRVRVGEMLRYEQNVARDLHEQDRVHTYGAMYVADLAI